MGNMMANCLGLKMEEFSKVDLIIPVPIHYIKLIKRRYNQAALIARQVAIQTGNINKLLQNALIKINRTESQVGLSRLQRLENLRGSFKVNADINGANILLIDDVITTGATISECCETLLSGGANSVMVATFAKV
jgi:ComF family protein